MSTSIPIPRYVRALDRLEHTLSRHNLINIKESNNNTAPAPHPHPLLVLRQVDALERSIPPTDLNSQRRYRAIREMVTLYLEKFREETFTDEEVLMPSGVIVQHLAPGVPKIKVATTTAASGDDAAAVQTVKARLVNKSPSTSAAASSGDSHYLEQLNGVLSSLKETSREMHSRISRDNKVLDSTTEKMVKGVESTRKQATSLQRGSSSSSKSSSSGLSLWGFTPQYFMNLIIRYLFEILWWFGVAVAFISTMTMMLYVPKP
eukprot:PhM_4_TR6292/c0_g1_i2/m.49981